MIVLLVMWHDSVVFEAPERCFADVAEITASVMKMTLQEHYPDLKPKVDLNIAHPQCWNKDGNLNAIEEWAKHTLDNL